MLQTRGEVFTVSHNGDKLEKVRAGTPDMQKYVERRQGRITRKESRNFQG